MDLKEAITLLRNEVKRLQEKADKLEEIADFLESVKNEEDLEEHLEMLLKHGRF